MENNIISSWQQQFPLSPKKFWKKMIVTMTGFVIWVVLFLALALMLIYVPADDSPAPLLVWEVFFIVFALQALYTFVIRPLYIKAYIRQYFYSASDNFITIKKGVFAPAEIHVQYQKIQDVYVDQDIIDRILGIYDVHIASATATSGLEAHIDGVEESAADGLKEFLLGKVSGGTTPGAGSTPTTTTSTVAASTAPTINANQMISSEQYPIQSQWLVAQAFSSLFFPLLLTFYFGIFVQDNLGAAGYILDVIFFLFVFLIVMIRRIIWKNNYHFAFTKDYIQLNTKIVAQSETHMPYRSIQDVVVRQGILEKMFGLGSVYIQNAAMITVGKNRRANMSVVIPGQKLDDANKIADVIRSITLGTNTSNTGL